MREREDPRAITLAERAVRALHDLARGAACAPGGEAALLVASKRIVMAIAVLACAEARGLAGGVSIARVHRELAERRGSGAWPSLAAALAEVHAALGGSLLAPRGLAGAPDGFAGDAVLAALDKLLANGAWADLDVEAVVGAYEGLVGLDLVIARGPTMLLLPHHAGADLDALLAAPPAARAAHLAEAISAPTGARLAALLERAASVAELEAALVRRASPLRPDRVPAGAVYLQPGEARRRAGAHYTPRALTAPLVARTLQPLFDRAGADVEALLGLRVCDPSMGSGAFLVEACRQIAARVVEIDPAIDAVTARRLVAERCLHGVDADPLAVDLARAAVWLVVGAPDLRLDFADARLLEGDALVGAGALDGAIRDAAEALGRARSRAPFHWRDAFPEVMAGARAGFDAFVGNPPWVAYAGRAAQPLADDLFAFYVAHYPSFFAYRTLHGLFVYRAASLLAPGGRLGLVVPTSVSDLQGYEPTRRAHDALCEIDAELPDFGDAFEGVFQPSMGLLSTRRASPEPPPVSSIWRVARDDVDPVAASLLARLSALPPLPPACFGERGLQTSGDDVKKLRRTPRPDPPFVVPIREGGDVRAFAALPPRLHLDPTDLTARLRADDAWREVSVLVRQTARFPIAARSDGLAFRNSILACFGVPPYRAEALLAYLNASPIRWLHYMRHRDARQGMPQVKIAHLRAIPRIPGDAPGRLAALADLGAGLGARNDGITADEQRALDDLVAAALGLSDAERATVSAWAAANPAP